MQRSWIKDVDLYADISNIGKAGFGKHANRIIFCEPPIIQRQEVTKFSKLRSPLKWACLLHNVDYYH